MLNLENDKTLENLVTIAGNDFLVRSQPRLLLLLLLHLQNKISGTQMWNWHLILTVFPAGVPRQTGTVSQITAAENDNWRPLLL